MRPPSRVLLAARLLLGRTQAQVAADAAISPKTIFKAENGTAGVLSVEKLAQYYADKGVVLTPPSPTSGWVIEATFLKHRYDDDRRSSKNR
ncbi:helix-turn-helix domain-containing protein [Rhizobium binae]|uniref:helix-turn-helix domain-containing protein n=1 Tax=Rhizobium binae TaxID=1138190 RepID=UPI003DA88317